MCLRSIVFLSTGLRPQSIVARRLATMCVLPLFLSGILGHPSKRDDLMECLRNLLIQHSGQESQSAKQEIFNSVRFIWFVSPETILKY